MLNNSAPAPEMYYRIVSSDQRELRVSERALQQSKILGTLISILGYTLEDVERNSAIPLTNLDGNTLELVFKWCEEHKSDSATGKDFDEKFMNEMDDTKRFYVICAAYYLGIENLVALVWKSSADRINAPVKVDPTPTTISRKCSRCGSTETCKWRQCRSPNILCNACFIYHRKFNKDRPESASVAYEFRKMKKTH
ncbi:hypothetical protein CAEBREN_07357 [Caenorhabditis brenneri]|uniref:GATA-type domain-containing protein n=1 Tax=Caenorhabditis brenneri TaxID=135651 RepID=G0MME1_CAEBE|nr:hypothetical protein CAEBREN_07357 [Caenorhabditis brenneri]